jgi:hypothetical protein
MDRNGNIHGTDGKFTEKRCSDADNVTLGGALRPFASPASQFGCAVIEKRFGPVIPDGLDYDEPEVVGGDQIAYWLHWAHHKGCDSYAVMDKARGHFYDEAVHPDDISQDTYHLEMIDQIDENTGNRTPNISPIEVKDISPAHTYGVHVVERRFGHLVPGGLDGDDPDAIVSDHITNWMHWCHRHGGDADEMVERGFDHFYREAVEPDDFSQDPSYEEMVTRLDDEARRRN